MPRRIAVLVALSVTVIVGALLLAISAGAFDSGDAGDDTARQPAADQQVDVATGDSAIDEHPPGSSDDIADEYGEDEHDDDDGDDGHDDDGDDDDD